MFVTAPANTPAIVTGDRLTNLPSTTAANAARAKVTVTTIMSG